MQVFLSEPTHYNRKIGTYRKEGKKGRRLSRRGRNQKKGLDAFLCLGNKNNKLHTQGFIPTNISIFDS